MSGFMTRWVVLQEEPVAPRDLDLDGAVRDETIARWAMAACSAYLARCRVLQSARDERGLSLQLEVGQARGVAHPGDAPSVWVSASTTEVQPDRFTMSVRMRASDESPVDVSCVVSLEDPATGTPTAIGDDVRDELIALEHSASHFN